jgi:hypothetical protein
LTQSSCLVTCKKVFVLFLGPNSCSMSIANTGLESSRGTLYKNSLRNQAFTQGSNPLGDNKFVMVGAREITFFSGRIQRSRSKNAQIIKWQLLRATSLSTFFLRSITNVA